jgi:hypothetical protein
VSNHPDLDCGQPDAAFRLSSSLKKYYLLALMSLDLFYVLLFFP